MCLQLSLLIFLCVYLRNEICSLTHFYVHLQNPCRFMCSATGKVIQANRVSGMLYLCCFTGMN